MRFRVARTVMTCLIPLFFAGILTTGVHAQITANDLIGSSVDKVDERYRNVEDAIALFQRGNGPAALAMFREAKKQRPELPPGELLFAHLCFATGNVKPGREILQAAAVSFPNDPEVWNMLADLQLREEHFAEASVLFEKALQVAEIYQGNSKRKTRLYTNALAGAALSNERRGLWKEAEPFLKDWLLAAPENVDASSRLAVALMNTQRFEEAAKTLEALRKLNPNQLPPEIILGAAYERLGKKEEAKASMLEGLEKYPGELATQLAVAQWALSAGQTELPLQCASAAAAIDPASHLPDLIIAQVDYLKGNFAKSEAQFQKVYQAKPGNQDAISGLALAILAQQHAAKYKLALEYAQLVTKSNNDLRTPQGRQAATILAWALHRNGRNDDAERLMTRVLSSGAVNADAAYFAAAIYAQQGKKELAMEAVDKAIASKATFPYRDAAAALKKRLATASAASATN